MIADLKKKIEATDKRLKSVQHALDKLVQAVISGTLTKETISKKEKELIEAKTELEITLQSGRTQLSTLPDIDAVKKEAEQIRRQLLEYYSGGERLQEMTFEEKRKLLHWLFDGQDKKGTPYSIYITKHGKRKDTKLDYFLYGRIMGLRTLKGEDIDFQEDDPDYKSKKVINY
jgi:chromosome segregation ATPase